MTTINFNLKIGSILFFLIWCVGSKVDLKFIYSEKATKFCEIYTLDLSYVVPDVPVKTTVEILQNFAAFSKYMNFTPKLFNFMETKFTYGSC